MSRTRIALNIGVIAVAVWLAATDLCLVRRAPSSHIEMKLLVFAFCLQLCAFPWLWFMVNNYISFSHMPLSSKLKAALLILPLFFVWISRDMAAGALYSNGSTDKIVNARRTGAALDCCQSISDLVSSIVRPVAPALPMDLSH